MRPVLVIEDDQTDIEAIREGFKRDVFTDRQTETSRYAAYERGANAYVVKPPAHDSFIETVRRIAKFWIEMNRLPPKPEE